MVNKDKHDRVDEQTIEVTNEEMIIADEPELTDIEERSGDKIKDLRDNLHRVEEEKRQLQDDLQRARADFLNARRRLDEERSRDRVRFQKQHIEELLPLCDSFQMAMGDSELWSKADESWRKGMEGIHGQLLRILEAYKVTAVDPLGLVFDPRQHEAVDTEVVEEENRYDTVTRVLQKGYEMQVGDKTELVRPARVTIGVAQK